MTVYVRSVGLEPCVCTNSWQMEYVQLACGLWMDRTHLTILPTEAEDILPVSEEIQSSRGTSKEEKTLKWVDGKMIDQAV